MNHMKKLLLVMLAFTLAAALAACGNSDSDSSASPAPSEPVPASAAPVSPSPESSEREIQDMSGTTMTIPAEVNRVGASIGAINQIVLLLGSPDKLVATLPAMKSNSWFAKFFPGIENVPTPFSQETNLEELLAAKPDVVFSHVGSSTSVEAIRNAGVPVVEFNISDPDNVKKAVMLIGKVLGPDEEKKAAEFCEYYDANVKRVTDKTASLAASDKPKVYFATGDDPLGTEGKGSIITAWIEQAGGVNVAAEGGVEGIGQKVSIEDIVKWNPDVIMVNTQKGKDAILQSDQWQTINAVKNNKIYVNPKGVYLWSVRSAEVALQPLWAGKTLHPELFADLDLESAVKEFYKTYYNYDLSDSDVESILNPA